MEREDGEMSDDNAMIVDDDVDMAPKSSTIDDKVTVLFKAEKDGLEVKQMEKVDAAKIEERAKRFGLNLTGNRVITQNQIDELYANFGIESGNERHFRFDAIYLNGVEGLNTKDIFEYLEDYKPVSLEWIDDLSCNVVCQDHISAALALLLHSREIKDEELKEMLAEKSSHHWREGIPHPKNDLILMRFATYGEKRKLKKVPEKKKDDEYFDQIMDSASKNPWGDLCKSWGVYDHQEVFQRKLIKNDYENEIEEEPRKPIQIRNKKLAMRLGKRNHHVDNQSDDSGSDSEWKSKSKTPRMRMHADDEESKIKKRKASQIVEEKRPQEKYAPLSIEVVNSDGDYVKREPTKLSDKFKFHNKTKQSSTSIRSRLGEKVTPASESRSEESNDDFSDDNSEHNIITSKVQKVNSRSKESSSVWSRLDVKQNSSASNSKSDLRQVLSRTKSNRPASSEGRKTNDLRERLGKAKQANLRIEIDNM